MGIPFFRPPKPPSLQSTVCVSSLVVVPFPP